MTTYKTFFFFANKTMVNIYKNLSKNIKVKSGKLTLKALREAFDSITAGTEAPTHFIDHTGTHKIGT